MFHTIWSKTLREYRVPTLCWGLGLSFMLYVIFATYSVVNNDAASQAAFAQLAQTVRFIGEPVSINTATGYTTWRGLGFFVPTLLSIWTLLAASNLLRGEEERKASDLLLSTPISRTRLLLEKFGALLSALLIIALLLTLGAIAGEASANINIDPLRALSMGLNVSLYAAFFASLALLLSQFLDSRGKAAGWTGGLLALSFLLDGTGRSISNGLWLQRFSPLYYYSLAKPLITTFDSNPWGPLLLLALSILFTLCSIWLFQQRDLGGVALPYRNRKSTVTSASINYQALTNASHDLSVKAVSLRTLSAAFSPIMWWLLSLIGYSAWITLVTPSMLEPARNIFAGSPAIAQLFSGHNVDTNAGFLGYSIFQFVPLLAVTFIFTLALKWSSDLDSGRMELLLSTPITRTRLLLEHFGSILLVALITPFFIFATVIISASIANLNLNTNNVLAASLGMLPLELLIMTFVYTVATRLRSSAILGLVSAYLFLAFLLDFLRSILKLPDWVMSLSIFHAYGSPIQDGWHWQASGIMLAITLLLLLIGVFQFARTNIDRGN